MSDRRDRRDRRVRGQQHDDHGDDAGARGRRVSVTVTNADAQSGTLASAFTYLAPRRPSASVAPASGPIARRHGADDYRRVTSLAGARGDVSVAQPRPASPSSTDDDYRRRTPAHAAGAVSVTVDEP